MRLLENRIPPPLVLLIVAAAMYAASTQLKPIALPDPFRLGVTAAFAVLGLAFLLSGVRAFGRAKTTINPVNIGAASSLVTTGIYRITRNPMYVGFTLLLLAFAAYLASPWTALGPLFFFLFIGRFQIQPEERVLAEKFGDAFAAYKKQAPRWL